MGIAHLIAPGNFWRLSFLLKFQEYEAHQNKVLAKLNKQHMHAAISRSLEHSQHHTGTAAGVAYEGDSHFRSSTRRQFDTLRSTTGSGILNQADSVVSEDDAASMVVPPFCIKLLFNKICVILLFSFW